MRPTTADARKIIKNSTDTICDAKHILGKTDSISQFAYLPTARIGDGRDGVHRDEHGLRLCGGRAAPPRRDTDNKGSVA
jgi:hypothetical protein